MRKILITLFLVAALAVASLASGTAGAVGTKRVSLKGIKFSPKKVTIRRGSYVKWTWGSGFHNVVGRGFQSKTTRKIGYTYKHKFRKTGTYTIVCQVHSTLGMRMKVKVVK